MIQAGHEDSGYTAYGAMLNDPKDLFIYFKYFSLSPRRMKPLHFIAQLCQWGMTNQEELKNNDEK